MSEPNDKLIKKKEDWAREKRGLTPQAREEGISIRQNPGAPSVDKPRLPPGQHRVKGFPVLDLGIQPEVPLEKWSLDVQGLVENPGKGSKGVKSALDSSWFIIDSYFAWALAPARLRRGLIPGPFRFPWI